VCHPSSPVQQPHARSGRDRWRSGRATALGLQYADSKGESTDRAVKLAGRLAGRVISRISSPTQARSAMSCPRLAYRGKSDRDLSRHFHPIFNGTSDRQTYDSPYNNICCKEDQHPMLALFQTPGHAVWSSVVPCSMQASAWSPGTSPSVPQCLPLACRKSSIRSPAAEGLSLHGRCFHVGAGDSREVTQLHRH
jgi:hypothetical protein